MNFENIILERRSLRELAEAINAPQRRKAKARSRRDVLKIEVLTHYGNGELACVKCRFSDIRALCIDHVKGAKELGSKPAHGGTALYTFLKDNGYPSGYQTLCFNCNAIKSFVDNGWGEDG